jgi:hypothetical protein
MPVTLIFIRRDPMRRKLKRQAFFVDEDSLARAQKALGARTKAEAVRLSVERIAEMERFWRFMKQTAGTARPGSFRRP